MDDNSALLDMLHLNAQASLNAKVVAPSSHQKGLQPADHLPDDILRLIFEQCLKPPRFDDQVDAVLRLRWRGVLLAVSKRWGTLLRSNPALWGVCSSKATPEINALSIKNSGNSPLLLFYSRSLHSIATETIQLSPSDLERCRWIEGRCTPSTIEIVHACAPRLETLVLSTVDFQRVSTFQPSLDFPCLTELRLDDLRLPWLLPPFSNLTALDLISVRDMSLPAFLSLLRVNPRLESLRLRRIQFWGGMRDGDDVMIPLVRLQHLELEEFHADSMRSILKLIDGPPLRRLVLHDRSQASRFHLWEYAPPSYAVESAISILNACPVIPLRFTGDYHDWMFSDKGDRNCVDIEGAFPNVLRWLLPGLARSGYHGVIQLRIPSSSNDVARIARCFRSYKGPLSVCVDRDGDTAAFIETLCQTHEGIGWPFPRMESLSFSIPGVYSNGASKIAFSLQKRYRRSDFAPFSPLRSLSYLTREPRPEFDQQIRAIPLLEKCEVRGITERKKW